ncbi:MAG TPA: formyltransferase family protein [Phycisphaerae bacterium]|nr:formyltransferase family protein [Phycisphaerae bacterium]
MRIALFTGNQPRHLALVERLAGVCDELFVVHECTTVFPGKVADLYRRSEVMQRYFHAVLAAERTVFGGPRFAPGGVRPLLLRLGDLSDLPIGALAPALDADVFVVFGASYIRGALCDRLVTRRALNLHMGISPYYRGSSTNFWAMYDRRPEFVGATIHLLTAGLDSGPILRHVFPPSRPFDAFELGMRAVESGQRALAELVAGGEWSTMQPVPQDRARQIRYTRTADFTDAVAAEYLARLPGPEDVARALVSRDLGLFVDPVVG